MKHTKVISSSPEHATNCNRFIGLAKSLLAARGDVFQAAASAEDQPFAPILKSAITAGTLADAGWASQLGQFRVLSEGFQAALSNFSCWDRMWADGALKRIPMRTQVACVTVAASGYATSETTPKKITKLQLDDNGVMEVRKAVAMCAVSDEVIKNTTPAAFALIGDSLKAGVGLATDVDFLNGIIDAVGTAAIGSSGTSGEDLLRDLSIAISSITTGANSKLYAAMPPSVVKATALIRSSSGALIFPNLNVDGGSINGVVVVPTDALSDTIVIMDGQNIGADNSVITLDASQNATLQLDDNPTSGGTPIVTSMFQSNMAAIKAERFYSFQLLRSDGAAVISSVSVTA